VLVVLQSVLITAWHGGLLVVAALHPVNGLAIFGLAGFLALRSRRYLPARTPTFAQVGEGGALTQGVAGPGQEAPV
jgi:hypothetical protein